jgi:hypothetical protein
MLKSKILKLTAAAATVTSVLGLTALAAGGASAATPAHAALATTVSGPVPTTPPGIPRGTNASTTFNIYNFDGMCLGISGGNDDAPAVQWTCNGTPNQTWHWGSFNSAGFGQLVNGDGQCLGVQGISKGKGVWIYGWTCNGHPDQYWYVSLIDGYDVFTDYNSRLVLGIAGGSTEIGAHVVQWPFTRAVNQYWY